MHRIWNICLLLRDLSITSYWGCYALKGFSPCDLRCPHITFALHWEQGPSISELWYSHTTYENSSRFTIFRVFWVWPLVTSDDLDNQHKQWNCCILYHAMKHTSTTYEVWEVSRIRNLRYWEQLQAWFYSHSYRPTPFLITKHLTPPPPPSRNPVRVVWACKLNQTRVTCNSISASFSIHVAGFQSITYLNWLSNVFCN